MKRNLNFFDLEFNPNCNRCICLCPTAVGPGGPGAQRVPAAVCVREAEGAAGHDGGPGLRGADGDRGHGACQAAPRVPPGPLNHIYEPSLPYTNTFAQCPPTPHHPH